ncbi:hypothetical protein SGUI_2177 [Serinicoccus hydrothermalis]|uniref:Uncharacterized protein n=1 Tax=Serinicoccus hydrothermalis TaxID=1758689 RepID=A0A1B1NDS1_9MICO|nr:hypothetical protein [Serinicoccus hydrothermalis]ANS79573.1 hypothetical protein SGUI_2177 [Serinicoccus hydrothermalis]
MNLTEVFARHSDGNPDTAALVTPVPRPSIKDQLATLDKLGLHAQDGVTAADIADDPQAAKALKQHPYVAAMHCLARDDDGGLTHHSQVTVVDLEHVVGPDSWADLVRSLAAAARSTSELGEVRVRQDPDRNRWVVRFQLGRVTRELHPRLDHDLADPEVLPWLFDAVCLPGWASAHVVHGQHVTVAYVDRWHVEELQRVLNMWKFAA